MKKLLLSFLAVMSVFVMIGSAGATPVTFNVDGTPDSYVNFTDIDTGITIGPFTMFEDTSISATLADLGSLPDFVLNDNESNIIDFFTFSVDGNGLGSFNLEANLNFDLPAIDAGGVGSGGWGTVTAPRWLGGGTYSAGLFSWDVAVQQFSLSDGNIVEVAMQDGFAIGVGSETTVHATITNYGGGVAPVPEPSTILLMGAGLLGLVGYNRRRFRKMS